ncbi:hypothetical protein O181_002547 [Austropuccinia psidii MF-1]|uniref:Uncharacterized protein n=1 Tax=Austropuccinia psidii MF-1 TaxID=1389203 RepID=A0A9Q3BCP0_9BASI|nr:hypothetical protein [Austropuccinia psidii MF-1]
MSHLFDTFVCCIHEAIHWVIESSPPEDIPHALNDFISIHDSEPFKLLTDLDQRREEFDSAVTELYDNLHSLKHDAPMLSAASNLIN